MREVERKSEMNSESASSFKEDGIFRLVNRDEFAKVVALIPAYNEERSIAKVIVLAQEHVDEAVACDDGSTDAAAMIAERLEALVVRHLVNTGKGAALKTAFEEVMRLNPGVVVTLDGDGHHDPEEIPRLVEPIVMGKGDWLLGLDISRVAKLIPSARHARITLKRTIEK